jgi:murein DD-endopeptidase MepM/ murein hydrolase activator NlpD
MIAAVAAGAFVAAGQSLQTHQSSDHSAAADVRPLAAIGLGGPPPSPETLPVARKANPAGEAEKLAKSAEIAEAREAREARAAEEARRPQFVQPAEGNFTSGFGIRWGANHYGVDIANKIGTPILAVTDGEIIEAGPASGFGLWVRMQHEDGTISVYGHVDRILAHVGQKVKPGDQIATMGNRGFSTGPHLHFEVWTEDGRKINPLPWLAARGISL